MAVSRRVFLASATVLAATAGTTATALAAPGDPRHRIPVSPDDTPEDLVRKASQVRPTARQIAWQRLERTAFLHFGVNTFTGLEWGTGDENPDVFQPAGLDTDQWARALRDGGFELAILTVKHHDGFVLYPSRYTRHTVASSSWRDGRGDVLRAFADSMRRYGIKVGVYISPADENQYLHGVYANGSARADRTIPTLVDGDDRTPPRFRTLPATDYGAHMLNQLYEVLTECGPVDEVWFDGAQGHIPPDKVETYDWDSWYALVRDLAPDAVVAVTGRTCAGSATRAGWPGRTSGASCPSRRRAARRPARGRLPAVVVRRVRRVDPRRLVLPRRPAAQERRAVDGPLLPVRRPELRAAAQRPAGHRRAAGARGAVRIAEFGLYRSRV